MFPSEEANNIALNSGSVVCVSMDCEWRECSGRKGYTCCVDLNVRAYVCSCRQPLPKLPEKNFTHLDLKLRQLREEERVRRNGLGGNATM